ncbi:uncharacterized protein LOC117977409 isoform X2 [Pan paniscus]
MSPLPSKQPLVNPRAGPLFPGTSLASSSRLPRTPLTGQSGASSAVCGSRPAFSPRLDGCSLPRNCGPSITGPSQGHWPGLSDAAEGLPGEGAGWEGWGSREQGAGRGPGGSRIGRKHLGRHEGWISCGPALERGNQCFRAHLVSPPSSCPCLSHPCHPGPQLPPNPSFSPNPNLPCRPSHRNLHLPLLPGASPSSHCGQQKVVDGASQSTSDGLSAARSSTALGLLPLPWCLPASLPSAGWTQRPWPALLRPLDWTSGPHQLPPANPPAQAPSGERPLPVWSTEVSKPLAQPDAWRVSTPASICKSTPNFPSADQSLSQTPDQLV